MTFAQMQIETSRRLAEVSGRVFWSDAEIATALNDGYAELSDASEWFETYVDIDLLADRPYYDARTVLGDSFLAIGPAFDRQTNRWLLPTSVRQFDAHDRRWERVVGEPQRLLVRGLWWLGYWPRLQRDVGTIKQAYTALPDPLVADSDEPGFPDTFHYGCINFALTDLWAQDSETRRALAEWTIYLAQETALTQWVRERAADATMHGYGAIGSVAR
jgi:hypothetical protein